MPPACPPAASHCLLPALPSACLIAASHSLLLGLCNEVWQAYVTWQGFTARRAAGASSKYLCCLVARSGFKTIARPWEEFDTVCGTHTAVQAGMHACVRACVRACVCVCVCARLSPLAKCTQAATRHWQQHDSCTFQVRQSIRSSCAKHCDNTPSSSSC